MAAVRGRRLRLAGFRHRHRTKALHMNRRDFLTSSAAAIATLALPAWSHAAVPSPYDWDAMPPIDTRAHFISWMQANRGENPKYLGLRYDRFKWMVSIRDLFTDRDKRAFLMTPREEFCLAANLGHVYDIDFLDIGYGVTISGPGLVGRMTSSIDVKRGDKVLEIGTGSGYQSAVLANLTDKVWTIEIIPPLFERTRRVYDALSRAAMPNTRRSPPGTPTATTVGKRRPLRQDHRHLRHRPHPATAFAAIGPRRHHGDPDRPARCTARPEGRQERRPRRQDRGYALRHLQRPRHTVRAIHQSGRRRH